MQVTKGPIGTKGPRITTNIGIPGRYLVLLPNSDQSGISRKIDDQQERQRLKKILRDLSIPEGMGVIIRTVGEQQQTRYFIRDLALLLEDWQQIQDRIKSQPLASCVFQEPDLIERTVRDFLTEEVDRIVVDSPKAYDRMREMISKISKRSANKVKLYAEPQPIFDRFNITRQLENAFSRQVHLKAGGYIVRGRNRGAGRHRRQHRPAQGRQGPGNHHPQSQHRGRRRNLPPAPPAQYGRTHRHRLHRHESPPRPANRSISG